MYCSNQTKKMAFEVGKIKGRVSGQIFRMIGGRLRCRQKVGQKIEGNKQFPVLGLSL
jgi:hypothetical protein